MMVKAPFGGFLVERCAKSPENYPGFEEHLSRVCIYLFSDIFDFN